jgi:hypothetical protein
LSSWRVVKLVFIVQGREHSRIAEQAPEKRGASRVSLVFAGYITLHLEKRSLSFAPVEVAFATGLSFIEGFEPMYLVDPLRELQAL